MMRLARTRCLTLTAVLALAAFWAAPALACPMCADNLPAGAESSEGLVDNAQTAAAPPNLAQGFYYSIVFMLAVPIALSTAVGVAAYVAHRRGGWNRAGIPAPPAALLR